MSLIYIINNIEKKFDRKRLLTRTNMQYVYR